MKKIEIKNSGITLVALVITIILLLILAGISIATLTGSGLFENARLAEQRAKEAENKEKAILDGYQNEINSVLGVRESFNKPVELLPETTITVNGEYDLKDSMEKYDRVLFIFGVSISDYGIRYDSKELITKNLKYSSEQETGYTECIGYIASNPENYRAIHLKTIDDKKVGLYHIEEAGWTATGRSIEYTLSVYGY